MCANPVSVVLALNPPVLPQRRGHLKEKKITSLQSLFYIKLITFSVWHHRMIRILKLKVVKAQS